MPTAGVTTQNFTIAGLSGSSTNNQITGVTMNAANTTVQNFTIQNIGNYGIAGGAQSNQTVTNGTITNTGYIGISMVNNTGTVSGIVVSNNTIDRTAQGVGVQQPGLIVRAATIGGLTGAQVINNIIKMPSSPSVAAAEGCEARNIDHAYFNGNTYIGGSIGFSLVGSSFVRSPNGAYSGQSIEAVEIVNDSDCSVGTGSGAITSGYQGFLVDGNTVMSRDTITKSTISGLSFVPIVFNIRQPLVGFQVNNVTATTVNNAARIIATSGITFNNDVFTGNNTTSAFTFDTSPGGLTDNNSTYSGFLQYANTFCCSVPGTTAVVVDNILTNGVKPATLGFLKITPNTNVTLGPNIHFNPAPVNTPVISYSSPQVYTQGIGITPLTPTNTGSAATSWSVSPAFPPSLVLNTSTGVVSGIPTVIASTSSYVISATNAGGSGHATLVLTVNAKKPHISYAPTSQTYTQFSVTAAWNPINTGGSSTSWTISPALGSGLAFNGATGSITGTPTNVQGATTYKVKASNTGGVDSTSISITVRVALPVISYTPFSNTFTVGTTITPLTPASTGGAVVSWIIAPSLPTGLSMSTSTGVISGTPTVSSPSITYLVTATNASGIGFANVAIQVNSLAPNISYSPSSMTYTQFTAISPWTPSNSGGASTNWSVSPNLPIGLVFNTINGQVTGTPLVPQGNTAYIVSASNVSGTPNFTIHILINTSGGSGFIRKGGHHAVLE